MLTRDDFERYPTTHPRFWSVLQAHSLTRTFLFLGFSFTDPNLEHVFRFTGEDPTDLRSAAFEQVRALLVIAGQSGTSQEVAQARALGLGVVPVGWTGGAAKEPWEAMRRT